MGGGEERGLFSPFVGQETSVGGRLPDGEGKGKGFWRRIYLSVAKGPRLLTGREMRYETNRGKKVPWLRWKRRLLCQSLSDEKAGKKKKRSVLLFRA